MHSIITSQVKARVTEYRTAPNTSKMTLIRSSIFFDCYFSSKGYFSFHAFMCMRRWNIIHNSTILFSFQLGANTPLGTLAYVIQEQALLVRVNTGWQYVAVSYKSLFHYTSIIIIHRVLGGDGGTVTLVR